MHSECCYIKLLPKGKYCCSFGLVYLHPPTEHHVRCIHLRSITLCFLYTMHHLDTISIKLTGPPDWKIYHHKGNWGYVNRTVWQGTSFLSLINSAECIVAGCTPAFILNVYFYMARAGVWHCWYLCPILLSLSIWHRRGTCSEDKWIILQCWLLLLILWQTVSIHILTLGASKTNEVKSHSPAVKLESWRYKVKTVFGACNG